MRQDVIVPAAVRIIATVSRNGVTPTVSGSFNKAEVEHSFQYQKCALFLFELACASASQVRCPLRHAARDILTHAVLSIYVVLIAHHKKYEIHLYIEGYHFGIH